MKINMLLGGTPAPGDNANLSAKKANAALFARPLSIPDAPSDGNLYARQNGAWILVYPPEAWVTVALDAAWTGQLQARQGPYGNLVDIYGSPTFSAGTLPTGVWTTLATLPSSMFPTRATAFLEPSQHANTTPDYCYVYVETTGVITVMPNTNKVTQVLIDFAFTRL